MLYRTCLRFLPIVVALCLVWPELPATAARAGSRFRSSIPPGARTKGLRTKRPEQRQERRRRNKGAEKASASPGTEPGKAGAKKSRRRRGSLAGTRKSGKTSRRRPSAAQTARKRDRARQEQKQQRRRSNRRAKKRREYRQFQKLVKKNPIYRRHSQRLAKLDAVIDRLNNKRSGVRIYLKGGSLYSTVGAIERGYSPDLRDIDLIVSGLTVEQTLQIVDEVYSGIDHDVHVVRKPAHSPGVSHVQIEVPAADGQKPVELDLSIYEPGRENLMDLQFDDYPGVSFGKMKLRIDRGVRMSDLLLRASYRDLAREMTGPGGALYDPDRTGIDDVFHGVLRVSPTRVARDRLPEGILQALYMVGKNPNLTLSKATKRMYTNMSRETFTKFFAIGERDRSAVRGNYVLSSFRPDSKRNIKSVLSMGRSVKLWRKLFPAMRDIVADTDSWTELTDIVDVAHQQATRGATANEEAWTREWVFGAFLSRLPSRQAAREALEVLSLPEHPTGPYRFSVSGILESYDYHHGKSAAQLRRSQRTVEAAAPPAARAVN